MEAYLTGFLAVLLFTAFVKILTTLNILRSGLGLEGAGFGLVMIALALALALVVSSAHSGIPLGTLMQRGGELAALEQRFAPFLKQQADPAVVERLSRIAGGGGGVTGSAAPAAAEPSAEVMLAAFLITELTEAFQIALIILVPFLVIDLLVVNALMALGVTQLATAVVSMPLKLLLFFAIDGWTLLSEKLLTTYGGT